MDHSQRIPKGKQNALGQARRRQAIIDFIKENGPVKSGEIQKAFRLSRSSLSDDMAFIREQGLVESPKKGLYVFKGGAERGSEKVPQNPTATEPADRVFITPDKMFLRRWMILALLSGSCMTTEELHDAMEEAGISSHIGTLRLDLADLAESGLVSLTHGTAADIGRDFFDETGSKHNVVFYTSSAIQALDDAAAKRLLGADEETKARRTVQVQTLKELQQKLLRVLPPDYLFTDGSEPEISKNIGKEKMIPSAWLHILYELDRLEYKTRQIWITYQTKTEGILTTAFKTGMAVFSTETLRIYLVGRNEVNLYRVIPLDAIDIEQTKAANTDGPDGQNQKQPACARNVKFQSIEYRKLFDEMLNVSVEDPIKVKVRFRNVQYVGERVKRLYNARRSTAEMSVSEGGKSIVYTDKIRGLEDFARYLRAFGSNAVAEEPAELRERMIATNQKLLDLYGDGNG